MPTFQLTRRTFDEPAVPRKQMRWCGQTVHHGLNSPFSTRRARRLLTGLLCFIALVATTADAASWTNRLADGRRIQVDPNTNRVTVFPEEGTRRQLWDGVHRLEDGSTITIRSGVMVPNKAIVELRQHLPSPPTAESAVPCQRLVRKVCGLHDECADHAACEPARQLQQMSQDQAQEALDYPNATTPPWASEQCRDALADEAFFTACGKLQRGKKSTPCEQLFDKVCGAHQECRQQSRCPLAKQMIDMEAGERRAATDPDALTFTSSQCREALGDEEFFEPCQPP